MVSSPSLQAYYFEKAQVKAWFAQRSTTTKAAVVMAGIIGVGFFVGLFAAVSSVVREIRRVDGAQKKEPSLLEKRVMLLAAVKAGRKGEVEQLVNNEPKLIQCECRNKDYISEGHQQLDIAEIALRKGIHTCGAYDQDGLHPIHHAAQLGHKDIVDFFVRKGVNSTTRSAENKTAEDYLFEYNRARAEYERLLIEQANKEREAALARESAKPVSFHVRGASLPTLYE